MSYYQSLALDIVNPKPKKPAMSAALKAKDAEFSALYAKALAAGRKAGYEAVPVPMVVGSPKSFLGSEIDFSKPVYVVDEGACGFGWVNVRPGNSPFAKWLKAKGLASAAYGGGVDIWISEWNQSVDRKDAHARAMARVLREAGINAYGCSRLD